MMLIMDLNVAQNGHFTQSLAIIWFVRLHKWTLHPVTDKWQLASLITLFCVLRTGTFYTVHLCCLQLHDPVSLAGASWVERPQRHPSQSTPGKCGELCGARPSSADVCGRQPMEPLRPKGIVVSWKNLINLQVVKRLLNYCIVQVHITKLASLITCSLSTSPTRRSQLPM